MNLSMSLMKMMLISMLIIGIVLIQFDCSAQAVSKVNSPVKSQEVYLDLNSTEWNPLQDLVRKANKERSTVPNMKSKFIGLYSKVLSSGDTVLLSVVKQNHSGDRDLFNEFVQSQGKFVIEIEDIRKDYQSLKKYFEQDFYQKTLISLNSKILLFWSKKSYAGLKSYHLKISLYKDDYHITIESIFKKESFEEVFHDFDKMIYSLKWK